MTAPASVRVLRQGVGANYNRERRYTTPSAAPAARRAGARCEPMSGGRSQTPSGARMSPRGASDEKSSPTSQTAQIIVTSSSAA